MSWLLVPAALQVLFPHILVSRVARALYSTAAVSDPTLWGCVHSSPAGSVWRGLSAPRSGMQIPSRGFCCLQGGRFLCFGLPCLCIFHRSDSLVYRNRCTGDVQVLQEHLCLIQHVPLETSEPRTVGALGSKASIVRALAWPGGFRGTGVLALCCDWRTLPCNLAKAALGEDVCPASFHRIGPPIRQKSACVRSSGLLLTASSKFKSYLYSSFSACCCGPMTSRGCGHQHLQDGGQPGAWAHESPGV